jgi:mutator protein MutT
LPASELQKRVTEIIDVAAAIIYDRSGKILICRRGDGGNCAHLWEFPGGKRNSGENMRDCVIRECREELAVELKVGRLFAEFSYAYPDREIHFCFYEAEILSGTPRMNVHTELRWAPAAELKDFDFCPADAGILRRLAEGRRF